MAIKVTLLTHTPNPEQTVAMAAKLCYSPSGIEDIREGLDEEKTSSFIDMLASLGHASPTEHAYFTFGIEGISRACSHQLVRHRIASYSQQSQRYVDGTRFDFVTPPEIAKNEKALAAYEKALKVEADAYKKIRDALAVGYINEKCPDKYSGTDEEIINAYKADDKKSCNAFIKKANEDARFILPNASTTKIVCTFNARSLQNFFAHRCCNRAQWEIREVAEQMLLQCLEVAPHLFKNCGPSCLFGPCPEGNMCCGKQKEIQFWKKECDNGGVILSDRYVTSNIIYQMSKLPKEEWNSFIDWLNDFEYEKLGIPKPDLVIYLDVEPEVSQKLIEKRYGGDNSKKDLHEKNLRFLLDCRKSAVYAAKKCGWKVINCCENGEIKSIEKISEEIERAATEIYAEL